MSPADSQPTRPASGAIAGRAMQPTAPQLVRVSPLLPVALGLAVGIGFADSHAIDLRIAAVVFAVGWGVAWLAARRFGTSERAAPSIVLFGGLTAAAAALGAARCELSLRRADAADMVRWADTAETRYLRLRGSIASAPRIQPARVSRWLEDVGGAGGLLDAREPLTRFQLNVEAVESRDGWTASSGVVGVTVAAPVLDADVGQRVELFGRLRLLQGPDNPGEYDWARAARRDGRRTGLYCDNERCVRILAQAPAGPRRLLDRSRIWLQRHLSGDLSGDAADPARSLLDAMVLGQRRGVDRALDEAFVAAGVVHFLCASGLNVVWLSGMVWAVLLMAGAHYRTQAVACIAAVIAYAFIAEPNPPILRAVLTGCLYFAAYLVRRPRRGAHWLMAAFCVLLLVEPGDLFNAGFQLSYASVAGLILLTPTLNVALTGPDTMTVGGVTLQRERSRRPRDRALRLAAAALTLSVAAWLAAAPIAAAHFGRVSPWGWLNSLVMSPLVFLVNLLGYGKLAVGLIWPGVGQALGVAAAPAAGALATLAGWLAAIPGCTVTINSPGWLILSAYYASLLLALGPRAGSGEPRQIGAASGPQADMPAQSGATGLIDLLTTRLGRMRRVLGAIGMLAAVGLWLAPWHRPAPRGGVLRVWILAVGDGNAGIIELPDGRNLACDLGSRSRPDVAERTLVPFLLHRGIRKLDDVLISHPDIDHFGGLPDLAARIGVGRVQLNPYFEPLAQRGNPAATALLADLERRGIAAGTARAGDTPVDASGARIDLVWPPDGLDVERLSDNDSSTVLRVGYQNRTILITGDIADAAMSAMLASAELRADVLIAPHHGSVAAKRLPDFIEAVDPEVIIRSSGVRDRETNDKLWRAVGDRSYYNTADCGAVCVTIAAGELSVECMRPSDGRPCVEGRE